MATIKPIIETNGLSFAYHSKTVLKDCTIQIPENQFTVVLGRNGSGKSTLLRLMAGLLPLQKGSVRIDGIDLKKLNSKQRAGLIGFLPQKHKAIFPFKVDEVVLTGRAAQVRMIPSEKDRSIRDEAIEMLGIGHLKHRIYSELSGGEQQLVMIARALAQQPKILLLDEPVSHLDYNQQIRLLRLLKKLVTNGKSIVTVLHDPNLALAVAEYFVLIHEEKVSHIYADEANYYKWIQSVFSCDIQKVEREGVSFYIPRI
ncbi:MAG: ABC transporter ATP-binding protein [Bacteroidales bacterium]|nr:ABC transporter ATP-binding protein [Bacteroidales bacterium]